MTNTGKTSEKHESKDLNPKFVLEYGPRFEQTTVDLNQHEPTLLGAMGPDLRHEETGGHSQQNMFFSPPKKWDLKI